MEELSRLKVGLGSIWVTVTSWPLVLVEMEVVVMTDGVGWLVGVVVMMGKVVLEDVFLVKY